MARPITLLAVFFLSVNLFSGFVLTTGIGADMGMETQVGGDDKADWAVENASEIASGAPTGQTLFGMYNVLADGLSTLALPVTGGPQMLERAGVPSELVNQIIQPIVAVVIAVGMISFLRGWGL